MKIQKTIAIRTLGLALLTAAFLFLYPGNIPLAQAASTGQKVPTFSLNSLDGKTLDLKDHVGSKVIVLALFHICKPCMNQALQMQALKEKVDSEEVLVVGVNVSGDSKAAVLQYLKSFPKEVGFPYLLDPKRELEKVFQVRFTPVVMVIDSKGIIRFRGSSVPASVLHEQVLKASLN